MLLRFIIGNYLSFSNETQFDMFPNIKRNTFMNHVYMGIGVPVQKGAAIFGGNGAGKSNLIHGLRDMKTFAVSMPGMQTKERGKVWYQKNRFRLPVADENKPIAFVVEFHSHGKNYIYQLEISSEGISKEALFRSHLGQKEAENVFMRQYTDVVFNDPVEENIRNVFIRNLEDKPFATIMAINGHLHLLDAEDLTAPFTWLLNRLVLVDFNRIDSAEIIKLLDEDSHLMRFADLFMSNMDIGIKSMNLRKQDLGEWIASEGAADRETLEHILKTGNPPMLTRTVNGQPSLTITESEGRKLVTDLLFNQIGSGDFEGAMELEVQSSGTIKLLMLLRYLHMSIYTDSTIVVDEISDGLHPMLLKSVLQIYFKCKSKGQLIYTAHDVDLLDQQHLIRTDEMWLVSKKQGVSTLYSLNEFKIHNTLSVRRGYLEGRFGGVPTIGENTILEGLEKIHE